jgi:copper resistance protein B
MHKLWLKAELERGDQGTESAELQALYSQAISPFWDLQAGVRRDDRPTPARDWLVLGVQGLAPYFFELEGAVFVGEQGRSAARIKAEYDLLFTQRLILSPSLEANAYGQNDPATGKGAGLADSRAGLRLRYEIYREFAPYVGVEWRRDYGNTAELTRATGQAASEHQWVLGLRAWF